MTFESPAAFSLLLFVPLMIGLFAARSRARQAAAARIGNPATLQPLMQGVDEQRRRWKSALWLIALTGLVIALARPVFGVDADVVEARGVAIIVVLDVSSSMDAQDVQPSRLERAKLAIRDLLQGAEGNLFGLVLFAGDAFVQFPLTTDVDTALTFVNAASTRSVTRQGTALEDALSLALATFDERISSRSIILLMTDGENQQGDPLLPARRAAERGISIHVIGYGTPEGDVIPVYDPNGQVIAFKTDRGQNLVITRLNEPILQQIATATGGLYQRASASGVEIVNVQNRIAEVEGDLLATRFQTRPVERFGVFVALALIALTAEMLISERGSRRVVPMLLMLTLIGCDPDPAERNNTGNALTRQAEYDAAIRAYQLAQVLNPDSPVAYYNAGIALANTDDFNAAALALTQALKTADDPLIPQAYYNLGNVYFNAGQYANAAEAFRRVLERSPDDANARYNYELALLYAVPPTPENQQQQNQPEDAQTDQNVTPTPQPNALTGPTETPPREDAPPDPSETPAGGGGDFFDHAPSTLVPQQAGRMSLEDAERLLEALEQDLEALSEYLNEGIPSGEPVENDW